MEGERFRLVGRYTDLSNVGWPLIVYVYQPNHQCGRPVLVKYISAQPGFSVQENVGNKCAVLIISVSMSSSGN